MDTEPVDALVAAVRERAEETDGAPEPVGVDGLTARWTDDGYEFAVGDRATVGLTEAEFRERAAASEAHVRNWLFWTDRAPPGEDRRAFLRWIEDAAETPLEERLDALADGIEATWGQLRVVARAERDAENRVERRYAIRHVADADRPTEDLTAKEDPLDARELTKYDDDGRYRPLSTAPTLQTGWQYADLDAAAAVRVVESIYPATIANWYREREGELDVTHWRATAERQTGIYDLLEDLPREAVEWVAEACCVDSQCLRRREWQYDEGDDLAVDGGDGVFPCREPCSLVIAAARKWTILEGETERTYEFELTPSEKAQLEELIDAVADGRVDEIREADVNDGANRFRARYLRAKRFDEEGNLCGVATGDHESADDGH